MAADETRAVYERASFGGALGLGVRPAILVVDFQRGFTDPACALGSDCTSAVLATRVLLDAARERRLPVVFTVIGFDRSGVDGALWLRKVPRLADLELGGRWVELDARLGAREEEPVLVKKGASAFFGTNLAAVLVAQGVDSLVVCGATTSGCIRATAVDALQHGFPALVPQECVADRAAAPHEANLFDIHAKYADVVALDEALSLLERLPPAARAGNEEGALA